MPNELQASYDAVAEDYANQFCDEMDKKPFDRKMLDWLAEKVGVLGILCDMGCGPGQIARYLHHQGVEVCGIDLSPAMVEYARSLNAEIPFQQGDMLALDQVAENSFGGIAAFYSIIHIPREKVVLALQELNRVLKPQGVLLLTFHIGQDIKHLDEFFGKPVSLDFLFFESAEMKNYLLAAGFELEEVIVRDPYPEAIEYQSPRAYLFARKIS